MIKRGDFVIVNEFDRPTSELVAVVTRIEVGLADCRYLSAKASQRGAMTFPVDEPTKIEDFGVYVGLNDYEYSVSPLPIECTKFKAAYRDGIPRQWQQDGCAVTQPLAPMWWPEESLREELEFNRKD